jgi:hypothetical protein
MCLTLQVERFFHDGSFVVLKTTKGGAMPHFWKPPFASAGGHPFVKHHMFEVGCVVASEMLILLMYLVVAGGIHLQDNLSYR